MYGATAPEEFLFKKFLTASAVSHPPGCLCHDPQVFLIEQSQDVGFESLRSKLVSNRHSISIGFKATLTKSSLKLYHDILIIDG